MEMSHSFGVGCLFGEGAFEAYESTPTLAAVSVCEFSRGETL